MKLFISVSIFYYLLLKIHQAWLGRLGKLSFMTHDINYSPRPADFLLVRSRKTLKYMPFLSFLIKSVLKIVTHVITLESQKISSTTKCLFSLFSNKLRKIHVHVTILRLLLAQSAFDLLHLTRYFQRN